MKVNKMNLYLELLSNKMSGGLNPEFRSILEYLYERQNRVGLVYMSLADMISTCDLYHLKEDLKEILIELSGTILEEWCGDAICCVKNLDELMIVELKESLK